MIDFGSILAGFGVPNGGQDGPQIGKLGSDSNLFFRLFFSINFGTIFLRFWGGFGRVLEPKMEAKSIKNGVKIEVETHIDFYLVFSRC